MSNVHERCPRCKKFSTDCFIYIYVLMVAVSSYSFLLMYLTHVTRRVSCYSQCWLRKACKQHILIVTLFLPQLEMKHTSVWCCQDCQRHWALPKICDCNAQEGLSQLSHVPMCLKMLYNLHSQIWSCVNL